MKYLTLNLQKVQGLPISKCNYAEEATSPQCSPRSMEGYEDNKFQSNYYRVYVGTGNNYTLVRSVLKYRWWLQNAEKPQFDKCNMIWTAWLKKKISSHLRHQDKTDCKPRLYARMDKNYQLANKKCLF